MSGMGKIGTDNWKRSAGIFQNINYLKSCCCICKTRDAIYQHKTKRWGSLASFQLLQKHMYSRVKNHQWEGKVEALSWVSELFEKDFHTCPDSTFLQQLSFFVSITCFSPEYPERAWCWEHGAEIRAPCTMKWGRTALLPAWSAKSQRISLCQPLLEEDFSPYKQLEWNQQNRESKQFCAFLYWL